MIASKNVTILINSEKDLEKYEKIERYIWPKLIALEWLNIINSMPTALLQELKSNLEGITLLGEHCGDKEH